MSNDTHAPKTFRNAFDVINSQSQDRRAFIRHAAALGLAAPALSFLVGKADSASASGPAVHAALPTNQDGQTQAVLNVWTEPATLLSGAPVTGAPYQQIQGIIANGLTRLGHPNFEVQPDLAESWEVSEDGLTHIFTLRSGVTWQDGEPFTAQDVKFTYDLVSHPDWPGALDSYFLNIQGAQEHKEGAAEELTGVQVLDDTQVQFTLTQPDTLFLASTTSRQRILPRHILESMAPVDIDKSDFARKPIYTGPYIVEEWLAGESITFRANDNYFGGRPNIDIVINRFISDPATAIAELQTGAVHAGIVIPDQFAAFVNDDSYSTQELPGLRIVYIQFDLNLPIFADVNVRKAISHAIDRQTVIDALYLGLADPATSFVPSLASIHNPETPQFLYDLEQADALLNESGWTLGDDGVRVNANGERLAFTLTVPTIHRQDGLAIQPFLQQIGIDVQIEELGAGQVTGPLRPGDYEAAIGAWNNFIIDPRADLQRFFQTPRPADQTGYQNAEVDALIQQARGTTDPEAERAIWVEVQSLIAADAPLALLWRQKDLLVVNSVLSVPEGNTITELYSRIPEWQFAQ